MEDRVLNFYGLSTSCTLINYPLGCRIQSGSIPYLVPSSLATALSLSVQKKVPKKRAFLPATLMTCRNCAVFYRFMFVLSCCCRFSSCPKRRSLLRQNPSLRSGVPLGRPVPVQKNLVWLEKGIQYADSHLIINLKPWVNRFMISDF